MTRRFLHLSFQLGIGCLLSSCLTVNDIKPEDYLNRAKEMIQKQQYQLAKLYVDSVRIRFPKEYATIREGIRVMREINYAEQRRTLAFCDSMLRVRQNELPEAQRNFKFVKNEAYETLGHYIHRSQAIDQSMLRTYLQTKVDEKGNLVLTSYYSGGRAPRHNQVKVSSSDGTFAETNIVAPDGELNYSFNDGEQIHEIVCFNRKNENGVLQFIFAHASQPIYVRLSGKNPITYPMSQTDKNVVVDAVRLSGLLTDITHLLDEIRLAQAKLEYIRQKQQSYSGSDSNASSASN